jgi:hypothetical protein
MTVLYVIGRPTLISLALQIRKIRLEKTQFAYSKLLIVLCAIVTLYCDLIIIIMANSSI